MLPARWSVCLLQRQWLSLHTPRRLFSSSSVSSEASLSALAQSVLQHDRSALARAMTLLESNHSKHMVQANMLMKLIEQYKQKQAHTVDQQNKKSIRIGISGSPGTGKSTFIEKLGQWIVEGKIKQEVDDTTTSRNRRRAHPSTAFSAEAAQQQQQLDEQAATSDTTTSNSDEGTEAAFVPSSCVSSSSSSSSSLNRLAILTIDPSSHVTGGSILGDRTRMPLLSQHPSVFIRPSPSKLSMGGTHTHTFSLLQLCELADYNIVLIETVGVGQSEVRVRSMCDVLVLLVNPGSGDELQGMKKGIVEVADLIIVNKADGQLLHAAHHTYADYTQAINLHYSLYQQHSSHMHKWKPQVLLVSSVEPTGESVGAVWAAIQQHDDYLLQSQRKTRIRALQQKKMLREQIPETLFSMVIADSRGQQLIQQAEQAVTKGETSVQVAAQLMVEKLMNQWKHGDNESHEKAAAEQQRQDWTAKE